MSSCADAPQTRCAECSSPDESCDATCICATAASGWAWFESVGKPEYWLAPMVGQSETAFRMLCRTRGKGMMCSTEMVDAAGYARSEKYRAQFPFFPEDQPLVFQIGGSNPKDLAEAARLAAPHCSAVELNVGCPQRCAKKGGYGAFLMDTPEQLASCVEAMAAAIHAANPRCACLVKIRCFEDTGATLRLARMLVRAGCQCLTVHGRTRHQGGGARTGKWLANWDWIRNVQEAVRVPVVANGNIRYHSDLAECLAATAGCVGVMSGCGALKRPFLFAAPSKPGEDEKGDLARLQAALEYLPLAGRYPTHPRAVAKHLTAMVPSRAVRGSTVGKAFLARVHALACSTRGQCSEDELQGLFAAAQPVFEEAQGRLACAGQACEDESDEDEGGASQQGGASR
ncbi:dihydrouridine synthase-domain-containing protein [Baffinella frigidus]|nr:dihydrouridine synthase-domain-containing protein [Cryptophyta sp. CCMP2293]